MKIFFVILICVGLFSASIFLSRPDLFRRLFKSKDSSGATPEKKPNL